MYVKFDVTSIHTKMGFAWPFVRPESRSACGKEAVIVDLMQTLAFIGDIILFL